MPSFFFPPKFDTVDEVFDFFATVEVPDPVLQRTAVTFEQTGRVDGNDIAQTHPQWAWDSIMHLALFHTDWDAYNDPDALRSARAEYLALAREGVAARPTQLPGYACEQLARLLAVYEALRPAISNQSDLTQEDAIVTGMLRHVEVDGVTDTLSNHIVFAGLHNFSQWICAEGKYRLDPQSSVDAVVDRLTEAIETIEPKIQGFVEEGFAEHERKLDVALDELFDTLGEIETRILQAFYPDAAVERRMAKAERRRMAFAGAAAGIATAAMRGK